MSKANFKTFGCKLNSYETEIMESLSVKSGLKNTTVFNTCAVTAEAVRKAKQSIRRSRRENPKRKIIVTGCAAQIIPEKFSSMKEVDFVIGNEEKLSSNTWNGMSLHNSQNIEVPKVQVKDIMNVKTIDPWQITKLARRSRAYVQIQSGCNHRCTFCIIPFGRGNSRSVSIEKVLSQVEKLVENGFKEIVLTGVDITSWGNELPNQPKLGFLVKQILSRLPKLPRLRLSSIDSVEIDEDLIEIITDEQRFMPHLHLSLQSGDNLILKRMKRRHSREQAIDFCHRILLKRPEITFGADLIVGFPTESESMFQNSLDLITECNLTWLHVFPFSARTGTPASKMPQLNSADIKKRVSLLKNIGQAKVTKYLDSVVGKNHSVLIEGNGKGRTEAYAEVILNANYPTGTIKTLVADKHDGSRLICS